MLNELHNYAMDFAERAFVAKFKGKDEDAIHLFEKALWYEKKAIEELGDSIEQPTHSILHRSAATLALRCKKFSEANAIAQRALSCDNVPIEIKEELYEVIDHAIENEVRKQMEDNNVE